MDSAKFWHIVLNGMDATRFMAYYAISLAGAIMFFIYSVYNSIKNDKNSPSKFNFGYLFKTSILRIILVLMGLFFIIPNFEAFRGVALDVKQALLTGIGADAIVFSVLGLGRNIKTK